jgi:hypothetical protein
MNTAGALEKFASFYQTIYARSLLNPHELPSSLTIYYLQKCHHAVESEDTVLSSYNTESSIVLRIK